MKLTLIICAILAFVSCYFQLTLLVIASVFCFVVRMLSEGLQLLIDLLVVFQEGVLHGWVQKTMELVVKLRKADQTSIAKLLFWTEGASSLNEIREFNNES